MTFIAGPDGELLVAPSANSLQIPDAVQDGFQILKLAAQTTSGQKVDRPSFKTTYAADNFPKLSKEQVGQLTSYGWTYDDAVPNVSNQLSPVRFFSFTKKLDDVFMRQNNDRIVTALAELRNTFPQCRFIEPGGSIPRVKIRADSEAELRGVQKSLNAKFSELRWEDVPCEHYGIHFVRVTFDQTAPAHYLDLASATSLEEITSDVQSEIKGTLRWSVLLIGAAKH